MTNKQAYAGLLERLRMYSPTHAPACAEAAEAISSLLKALEQISAPLGNAPETQDGDRAEDVIRWWRGVAVRCREIARAALNSDAPLSIGEGDRG